MYVFFLPNHVSFAIHTYFTAASNSCTTESLPYTLN